LPGAPRGDDIQFYLELLDLRWCRGLRGIHYICDSDYWDKDDRPSINESDSRFFKVL